MSRSPLHRLPAFVSACVTTCFSATLLQAQDPPLPALSGDGSALNVSLIGTIQVEPPWDEDGDGYFSTTDLFVDGDHAYMGSSSGLLHIINITDPTAMHAVARLQMPGPALDVKVAKGLAVVSVQNGPINEIGAVFVDVADPTRPRILSHVENPFWSGVHNSSLYQGRAYLAHSASRGISVVDLTDPETPFISGTWLNDTPGFGSIIHDIQVKDGLAFLSDFVRGAGGLVILDLSDPDHPTTLSSLSIAEGLHNCFADGQYVYCNQELGGWRQVLHIIDISDPRRPVEVGTYRMSRQRVFGSIGPHNTWVEDGLLYWSFYDAGLHILDVTDPVFPVEVGHFETPYAWGAQPHNGLVFVADARRSAVRALRYDQPDFVVRDLEAPVRQLVAGELSTFLLRAVVEPVTAIADPPVAVMARLLPDRAGEWELRDDGTLGDDVAGDGRYAGFVQLGADVLSGEYQIEVRAQDGQGQVYPRAGLPLTLVPSRDQAIIADQLIDGLRTTQPAGVHGPTMVSSGPIFEGSAAAAIRIEESAPGIWRLELQLAQELDMLGYTTFSFAFHPGDATGTDLAVALGDYNLRLLTRRTRRINLGTRDWQRVEYPLDVFLLDRVIPTIAFEGTLRGTFYLDDMKLVSENRVTAIEVAQVDVIPLTSTLGQGYPNPFNSSITLEFDLAQADEIDLEVYSITGQHIRTLLAGVHAAGRHRITWDGRDDVGREAATGVYLYRLHTSTLNQTRRMLLLR